MGTRSLTHVKNGGLESKTLVTIYRQFDGYPDGHGQELLDLLKGITIVNGLGSGTEKVANGMGCLSAQLVAGLKDKPGNIYLYPINSRNCWEEYVYTLYLESNKLMLKIYVVCMETTLYNGELDKFDPAKFQD